MWLLQWSVLLLVPGILGDIYFHSPRGSNNRLNEPSANRRNANRLFDSQNNNRGGHNVGDATKDPFVTEEQQYRMKYFQSSGTSGGVSYLPIEWTNQHGCGGDENTDPHKVNCNIVFQYMCQDDDTSATGTLAQNLLRNGHETDRQDYEAPETPTEEDAAAAKQRFADNVNLDRGLHETFQYYDDCYVREANAGLFIADRKLKKNQFGYNSAIHTRQNNAGTRRGFECPEERDYYPYWHPTPWKDIAILAVDTNDCGDLTANSFNTKAYHRCLEYFSTTSVLKPYSRWNNQQDCDQNGGQWTLLHNYLEKAPQHTDTNSCNSASYLWAIPHDTKDAQKECLVPLSAPDCQAAPWTRTNHLGNGKNKAPNNYVWKLPYFPSGDTKRCILRARYNISSDDYNPKTTDSTFNGDNSPVQNNPFVNVGADLSALRLAMNTAQFGRTFQDRTHVFKLVPRTAEIGDTAKIYNLNVRGKRGNIAQTFPAVEYDFFPNDLEVTKDDLIHIQWAGSNTHNNGNPAGDGQSGNAGQGEAGTDRHNLVQIDYSMYNFPLPMEKADMWSALQVLWIEHGRITSRGLKPADVAMGFATAGYYHCHLDGCNEHPNSNLPLLDPDMNTAPASYSGAVVQFKQVGEFYYMSSRNNAFTNRSQKGKITVV